MTKQASPPDSALSTAADESARSHRNPPLRCGLRHDLRTAFTPQGERSRLDSSTSYGTALRAQGSHDAATPDSLRSVGCHRWSLHALRYVASLCLRLSYVSSLAVAIGMRGQSLRHTHPLAVSGARFTLAWQAAPTPPATVAPTPRGEKCSACLTMSLTVTSHRQIQLAPQAARAGRPHVPTPHFATSRIPQDHLTWAHARR